eukprot:gnl/MRDRNA2_/MRDRNA2_72471_c0_seq1.p1 gnl/MRDRNA2_/MRDRNA2_72471_c0~~gnl/MRDRNA2_/MRDRNA2_72471_c0_seq1.p1  ORF type:complete len:1794 (+),score=462.40 gnl/MRDRNA2_/MRDRNA2_72471_c0_seq1:712-5382(+)
MTESEMQSALKNVPLTLVFTHGEEQYLEWNGPGTAIEGEDHGIDGGDVTVVFNDMDQVKSVTLSGSPSDWVVVDSVLPGGSAEHQGLVAGDVLVGINDKYVSEMTEEEMQSLMDEVPVTMVFAHGEENAQWTGASIEGGDLTVVFNKAEEIESFTFSGSPSDQLVASSMRPGGSAEYQGLSAGDVLLAINSKYVSEMVEEEVQSALKEVPLTLVFTHGQEEEWDWSGIEGGDVFLVFSKAEEIESVTLSGSPPEEVVASSVLPGGSAEHQGLSAGDVLVAINNKYVSEVTDAEMQSMMSSIPVHLVFAHGEHDAQLADEGPSHDSNKFLLVVEQSTQKESFTLTGHPPEEWVVVEKVVPAKYAETKGLKAGDTLTAINGTPVESMSYMQMQSVLRAFPVTLEFYKDPHGAELDDMERSHANDTSNWDEIYVEVNYWEELDTFSFSGTPPDDWVVAHNVIPGESAGSQGLLDGDVLISINGYNVSTMTEMQMHAAMEDLPLTLVFSRELHPEAAQETTLVLTLSNAQEQTSFSLHGTPPRDSVVVHSVAPQKWAETQGLTTGCVLVRINDYPTAEFTEADMNDIMQDFPVKLEFQQPEGDTETCMEKEQVDEVEEKDFGPSGAAPKKQEAEKEIYEVVADEAVASLGWVPSGLKPGKPIDHVLVKKLTAGGWAEQENIQVGDELLSLNGRPVAQMSYDEIVESMKSERPISMKFVGEMLADEAPADVAPAALEIAAQYGLEASALLIPGENEMSSFTLSGSPPNDWVVVGTITPGSWAADNGLAEGDILLTIGDSKVESMSEEEMRETLSHCPVTLNFGKMSDGAADKKGVDISEPPEIEVIEGMDTFALLVEDPEDHTSFQLSGSPPDDWVLIDAVFEGWATQQGLQEGDALIQIGQTSVSQMTEEQLQSMLPSCPIYLVFGRVKEEEEEAGANAELQGDPNSYEVTVPKGEKNAGWTFSGLRAGKPTDNVTVKTIEAGSWAEQQVSIGDRLDALNGKRVSKMKFEKVTDRLSKRPLTCRFVRPEPDFRIQKELTVDAGIKSTGLTFSTRTGNTSTNVFIEAVKAGKWGEGMNLKVGDELVKVNGKKVLNMTDEKLNALLKERPVTMLFMCEDPAQAAGLQDSQDAQHAFNVTASVALAMGDPFEFTCTAEAEHKQLGWKPKGLSPGKSVDQLFVKSVTPGLWADECGIIIGDEVLQINGVNCSNLTYEKIVQFMQDRPLELTLQRFPSSFAEMPDNGEMGAVGSTGGAKPPPQPDLQYEPIISAEVDDPGWSLSGLDPGQVVDRIFVEEVDEEGWAAEAEVMVGDELLALDGQDLYGLQFHEVQTLLARRPLPVLLCASSGEEELEEFELVASVDEKSLGWKPAGLRKGEPVEMVTVKEITPGGWAEAENLMIGDELLRLDGQVVQDMTYKQVVDAIGNTRPLVLLFRGAAQPPEAGAATTPPPEGKTEQQPGKRVSLDLDDTSKDPNLVTLEVPEKKKDIGIVFTKIPPDKPADKVLIRSVEDGKWGAKNGLKRGDELLKIQGRPLNTVTKDRFEKHLATRPLKLKFKCKPPKT